MRQLVESNAIGVVSEVDSERVEVELDPSTSGFVKAGRTGVAAVGSINSYLSIDAGPMRIVAVITGVKVFENQSRTGDQYDPTLAATRHIEAVMVGRIEAGEFKTGLTIYPPIFAPVSLASANEVSLVFAPPAGPSVRLGESVAAPEQDVLLDANVLLGHHCAILGSTGAGKSCTVTGLLDGLFEHDLPRASVIIFDTNGEYAEAFKRESKRGTSTPAVVIGPSPGQETGLVLPHWFMDNEDHVELLRASPGAQLPILQRSVMDARLASPGNNDSLLLLRIVSQHLETIEAMLGSPPGRKPQETLITVLSALETFTQAQAGTPPNPEEPDWATMAAAASAWQGVGLDPGVWDVPPGPEQSLAISRMIEQIRVQVQTTLDNLGLGARAVASNFDAPRYYEMEELYRTFMPNRIRLEAAIEPRVEQYCATLLMRLATLLADERYDFITRVPNHSRSLGRYLRLLLGFDPLHSETGEIPAPWREAYSAQLPEGRDHSVTIIDLSLVASEVLETVTAILARLLLDFAQRVEPRAAFPMLLVLEEAHRYVPTRSESPSRSAVAFERIAKEGRKYGVSLLMSSQRPSELSRTVLAQMGTVIAHRMTNMADQELLRNATAVSGRDVLRQLPGLAAQHAVVLGEAVAAPVHVRIRDVSNPPESRDPDFISVWGLSDGSEGARVDLVAEDWERGATGRTQTEMAEDSSEVGSEAEVADPAEEALSPVQLPPESEPDF